LFASRENLAYFPAEILKRGVQHAAPGIKNDGPICGDDFVLATHRLAQTALHAIALDRFAQSARRSKAKARGCGVVAGTQAKGSEVTAGHANTGLIDAAELRGPQNPPLFWK
jgi:hypothetical protein